MPRSRVARLPASQAPADAELNVMQLARAETSVYTFDEIMAATVDDHTCVAFMMRHGLISRTMLCRHCDGEMTMDTPCRR
ncbi:hypothetical protein PR003_g31818 [Phytophthora rubi]|nr:hypothetical protein PR003_g31818 [Phytophthora rubi]